MSEVTATRSEERRAGEATRRLKARQAEVLYPIVGRLQLYGDEPLAVDRAEGMYVYDVEGNEYLDFFGGILTTMVGHDLEPVVQAIASQARHLMHSSTLYLHESTIELAETIADLSGIPDAKVFFTTSGTEANSGGTGRTSATACQFDCSSVRASLPLRWSRSTTSTTAKMAGATRVRRP